jgi:hypothetical protein
MELRTAASTYTQRESIPAFISVSHIHINFISSVYLTLLFAANSSIPTSDARQYTFGPVPPSRDSHLNCRECIPFFSSHFPTSCRKDSQDGVMALSRSLMLLMAQYTPFPDLDMWGYCLSEKNCSSDMTEAQTVPLFITVIPQQNHHALHSQDRRPLGYRQTLPNCMPTSFTLREAGPSAYIPPPPSLLEIKCRLSCIRRVGITARRQKG